MKMQLLKIVSSTSLLVLSGHVFSHGLIESPPSRNQICGNIVKPDRASDPNSPYPACAEAFKDKPNQGYNFMSVLTHHRGRLRPLPPLTGAATNQPPANEAGGTTPALANNVCSYDTETFDGTPTVWDQAIDWPTTPMSSGRNKFTWNIEWGPHFDDTLEFSYWITKPDFTFEVGKPLSWADFEEQPFCKLDFDRTDYNANPNILVRDNGETRFDTFCEVPERSGRHVIYGEWGRNYFTWERFHGCVDVAFNGGGSGDNTGGSGDNNTDTIVADIFMAEQDINGAGSVNLDAQASTGNNLSYSWSVTGQNTDASYSFGAQNAAQTSLSYTNPSAAGTVTVALTVSSGANSNTTSITLNHQPEGVDSAWRLDKLLTDTARELSAGDTVWLRAVTQGGQDLFFPEDGLVLNEANTGASQWPVTLAEAVNGLNQGVAIGVLDGNDRVVPAANATTNYIYTEADGNISSGFLVVEEVGPEVSAGTCTYTVSNEWQDGFEAMISITNPGTTTINGWEVEWSYSDGSTVRDLWNANLSGSYTAANLDWNRGIRPGESVTFGFIGNKSVASTQIPVVTGEVCQ